jgi:hypothetical protein
VGSNPPEARIVEESDERGQAVGFSGVGLARKDAQTDWSRSFGFADKQAGDRNSAQTGFQIASTSKQFGYPPPLSGTPRQPTGASCLKPEWCYRSSQVWRTQN